MSDSPDNVSAVDAQDELDSALAPLRERLATHPIYGQLRDERTVRLFMKAHVFAVWDFQSLLKALQGLLTCVGVPWLPTADPEARRLVNEIVLDEESDLVPGGGHLSHFEIYLQAMRECAADTGPICSFIGDVSGDLSVEDALDMPTVPAGVRSFVGPTMAVCDSGQAHRIAAAFAYGREEIIPVMFRQLVESLSAVSPHSWGTLRYYLERHIGQDTDEHGPQSRRLVRRLCGNDRTLWSEAIETAQTSLVARLGLWNSVAASLSEGNGVAHSHR